MGDRETWYFGNSDKLNYRTKFPQDRRSGDYHCKKTEQLLRDFPLAEKCYNCSPLQNKHRRYYQPYDKRAYDNKTVEERSSKQRYERKSFTQPYKGNATAKPLERESSRFATRHWQDDISKETIGYNRSSGRNKHMTHCESYDKKAYDSKSIKERSSDQRFKKRSFTQPCQNVVTAKPLETDDRKLATRQRQIDIGKETVGYKNYIKDVKRKDRTKDHPWTPDKYTVCSTRSWQGVMRIWRRKLHFWDTTLEDDDDDSNSVTENDSWYRQLENEIQLEDTGQQHDSTPLQSTTELNECIYNEYQHDSDMQQNATELNEHTYYEYQRDCDMQCEKDSSNENFTRESNFQSHTADSNSELNSYNEYSEESWEDECDIYSFPYINN